MDNKYFIDIEVMIEMITQSSIIIPAIKSMNSWILKTP